MYNLILPLECKLSKDAALEIMVGYENYKPYLHTQYLNPYQKFFCLVSKESKEAKLYYWCHINKVSIINICNEYEISEPPIFEENNILVFLAV